MLTHLLEKKSTFLLFLRRNRMIDLKKRTSPISEKLTTVVMQTAK
jgi:hypothetical protein